MHIAAWRPCVVDEELIGVVVYNFPGESLLPPAAQGLNLVLGDRVRIIEEHEGGWYRGWALDPEGRTGVFPKNAVRVRPLAPAGARGRGKGPGQQEAHVAHEIFVTLKEWAQGARRLFVQGDKRLGDLRRLTYDLVELRKTLLSGTLPSDEYRRLQQDAVHKLSSGSRLLELDTIIRGEDGAPASLEASSIVEIYRLFKTAHLPPTTAPAALRKYTHAAPPLCCVVQLQNLALKSSDDAEVLVSLYDDQKTEFVTENAVLEWRAGRGALEGGRVVFADLKKLPEGSRVFLVAQIVRRGAMELRENGEGKKASGQVIRRPWGVAVLDVTGLLRSGDAGQEEVKGDNLLAPIVACGQSESLAATMRRAIAAKANEQKDLATVLVSGQVFRQPIKQVREEHPYLFVGSPPVARLLSHPDVVVPADVRNDIYISLERAEFKATRNVEVSVAVCDDAGAVLPAAIAAGVGVPSGDRHQSVVYYHEDKPRWSETVKLSVGFQQFASSHVRFTFKHRSSNENKDKNEKPFALAYLPLKSDDGTALPDKSYRLALYRIDGRKYSTDEKDKSASVAYLELPSEEQKIDLTSAAYTEKKGAALPAAGCFTYSPREVFLVSSQVCSTKLTQNVHLLGLLKWKTSSATIHNNLKAILEMPATQVLRFLQDILDVLFDILSYNTAPDPDHVDALVFRALVHMINLVCRESQQQFRPVLDQYIKENFFGAMAYHKLLHCLSVQINHATERDEDRTFLIRTMKAAEYLFKFIVQSRLLYAQMNQNEGDDQFRASMVSLLQALAQLTQSRKATFKTIQGTIIRYIPAVIPEILRVMEPVVVSRLFVGLIGPTLHEPLYQQQLEGVLAVVQSPLFRLAECRRVLLPVFCQFLHELLARDDDQILGKCAEVLGEILVLLAGKDVQSGPHDLGVMVETLLRSVVRVVNRLGGRPISEEFLVILLSIFRQMSDAHYTQLIASIDALAAAPGGGAGDSPDSHLLEEFLQEIFLPFRSLFSKGMFPRLWTDMIMLQNAVILEVLRNMSLTIRDRFLQPFKYQLWSNFFDCAVAFCTQEALQLETFSEHKRKRLQEQYEDMRLKMALEVRVMWNSLGSKKINFVPHLVTRLLDLSLIPVEELRRTILPLFFDMMQCEFRLPKQSAADAPGGGAGGTGGTASRKELLEQRTIFGKLDAFHHETMKALDVYIEGGRGDGDYVALFEEIMVERCQNNWQMKERALRLVEQLVEQMRLLFEYRDVMTSVDVDVESRMCCTVNLLEYYERICKREMYIRYLYKLRDLHLQLANYTEVAFTLEHHARLLLWTDEHLVEQLRSPDFPHFETHRELKEQLAYEMIRFFDMGKAWEYAINRDSGVFKELLTLYETDVFDYRKLSDVLQRMAAFYDKIISPQQMRTPCEYFRVAYWGRGFPAAWRNKAFVYRGAECENIRDFTDKQMQRFPGCISLKTMDPPGNEIKESDKMYLQVWKVEPVAQLEERFSGKPVSHRIRSFFLTNDIQTFTYHRRLHSHTKDADFANMWLERTTAHTRCALPGLLRWALITQHTVDRVPPIQTAIETLQAKNDDIHRLIEKFQENPAGEIDPQMGGILGGVVDPAVNGGIANYEKAFLSLEYREKHPDAEERERIRVLQELIVRQVPLLEAALDIYGSKVKDSMRPHYEHLHSSFLKQKDHVTQCYGSAPPLFTLPKQRPAAARSYSNVELRKNGPKWYAGEHSGSTLSINGDTPPAAARQPKRSLGSFSSISLRSSRDSQSLTPVELSQPLQATRPRRDSERKAPRPGSGRVGRPGSELSLAEENEGGPQSPLLAAPPPLPDKKAENGTLKRRKTLEAIVPLAPEKPPLPEELFPGLLDLPPKSAGSGTLRRDSPALSKRSDSSVSPRSASATPPPVPEKPGHLAPGKAIPHPEDSSV
ncbi:LOW QUALITY PROTEIN: dedicator of cytokinesis protein 1-like [Paramacrobiotus metropolitanus]|uniref:LOW QUALITY PROTEIN: dedicator of cytokinesis protein 1-like n=1 Tax=Paramacrobiotus metropolitanus TaxID=2943436 RepID=UPI00244579DD|nr:LOW QUALITY PROTEIN: dedicator of cytokinesis protein 1-like [Paramacrobiotus metropolitanus]